MGRFEFGYYGFGGYVRYRFGWVGISLIGILLRQLGSFCYGFHLWISGLGNGFRAGSELEFPNFRNEILGCLT